MSNTNLRIGSLNTVRDSGIVQHLLDALTDPGTEAVMIWHVERWLIEIGARAAGEIWERVLDGRLSSDQALDILEQRQFKQTPADLAPMALQLLRSDLSRWNCIGADLVRRFSFGRQYVEIASCLWKLLGSDDIVIRTYAAEALARMAEYSPEDNTSGSVAALRIDYR